MEIKNILLTTDFSKESSRAFPVASQLAKKFQAKTHLVHVAENRVSFYLKSESFGGVLTEKDFFTEIKNRLVIII